MSKWCVYLLVNERGRTYVGSTTDPLRRLRQHNGELTGGARSTNQKGPWKLYCYLSGFQTRSEACRWEKLVKSRARGLQSRRHAMEEVSIGTCPLYNKRKQYPVPANLTLTYVEEDNRDV
jgi:predicted GIY-YIG superfamily endonuclease